ncbi:AAA domain-containing protein, putative AbiEii toxin, Type IV TA system [Streptomyces sp. PAN_FS17]|nr:AAA domain-containing protein, putative AbiEii toxin, Type IV TA system [Streptomyces sp. PAN_FS17]
MHPDYPPFYDQRRYRSYKDPRPSLSGECRVLLSRRNTPVEYVVDFTQSTERGSPPEVVESGGYIFPDVINPHLASVEINTFFQDFHPRSLEDRDAAGEPEVQKKADLDALRDILGVTYQEVTYIPVDVGNGYDFPYVRARKENVWIDSHQMSHGELCVHYIRWVLRHSSSGVVLLDEPEANIAPRGHAALLDEIARLARVSKSQVVLSTHSAAFLTRVPLSWVRMCVRPSMAPLIIEPSRPSDLRDTLGIENPLKLLLVVEDDVAQHLLNMILAKHSFPLLSESEIVAAGSWNDVLTTTKAVSKSSRISAFAVLDGDQRSEVSGDLSAFFLPGNEPPEKVIFKYAATRPDEIADKLGCSLASMNVYIAGMLGMEHHRWLTYLSRRTGQDWRYCLRAAFDIWHADPTNSEACEDLTRGIEAAALSSSLFAHF